MNSVVFAFGRMNPPTKGHEKLVQKVISTAKEQSADHVVYLSQTQKAPTDPLAWDYKQRLVRTMFPGVNISSDRGIKSPFHALEHLAKQYDNITFVAGSDRLEEFTNKMTPYAEQWGVKDFNVISSGGRDPDSSGTEGISASKARHFAERGDFDLFARSLSDRLSTRAKQDVYDKIRTSLGLEEDANNNNADAYRRKGLKGIFAYSGWG